MFAKWSCTVLGYHGSGWEQTKICREEENKQGNGTEPQNRSFKKG